MATGGQGLGPGPCAPWVGPQAAQGRGPRLPGVVILAGDRAKNDPKDVQINIMRCFVLDANHVFCNT